MRLPLRTLWGVRLCLEQTACVREPSASRWAWRWIAISRTLQILWHGRLVISPVHRVHRQFGCGLTYTQAKGLLEPSQSADTAPVGSLGSVRKGL
jgi:hypothetical protein